MEMTIIALADNWLNVSRLELTVFTDNARAISLYKKHGFEIEGTHRSYALRYGNLSDAFAMARLKP
jgi:L-phenylalanine/L-methionine N-acetyltransferase